MSLLYNGFMIIKECYIVPIRIESEANKKEHWSKTSGRHKRHRLAIRYIMLHTKMEPPCEVILTRIAPRMLDEEDNLPASLKHSKDVVADILIKGLAPGRADGDKRITWKLKQEKGKPKEYALKIEMTRDYGADSTN